MSDEITQEMKDAEEVDIEPFEGDPDFEEAPWAQNTEGVQDDGE